ncbi:MULTISPECIES: hypothetical protein [unclassified Streptomyces]|uniref:hypothetical protein n=1 Tax=unclassified Streptomyces TaxID=2593676 RepID=UPI00381A1452
MSDDLQSGGLRAEPTTVDERSSDAGSPKATGSPFTLRSTNGDAGPIDASLCEPHGAQVSRDGRRPLSRHERLVTQRCRLVGGPAARAQLDILLTCLADAGFAAAEVEAEEFVVHDDDLVMDEGRAVADGSGAA